MEFFACKGAENINKNGLKIFAETPCPTKARQWQKVTNLFAEYNNKKKHFSFKLKAEEGSTQQKNIKIVYLSSSLCFGNNTSLQLQFYVKHENLCGRRNKKNE